MFYLYNAVERNACDSCNTKKYVWTLGKLFTKGNEVPPNNGNSEQEASTEYLSWGPVSFLSMRISFRRIPVPGRGTASAISIL